MNKGLFDFLSDLNNYESRCVDRYEKDDFVISTAAVSDSDQPYETAVAHPEYNSGLLIIVEDYATEDDAKAGHKRWEKKMTAPVLPDTLKDISTCAAAELADKMKGSDDWRVFKRVLAN